jgi:hypothetical protein
MTQRRAEWRDETRVCAGCGCDFSPNARAQRYHSMACAGATGRTIQQQKALGRDIVAHGHRWVAVAPGERVAEHRLMYEQSRGVKLQPWHYIDWIDGDRLNNDPANLRLSNTHLEEYVRTTGTLPAQMGKTICPKHLTRKDDVQWHKGHCYVKCAECRRERVNAARKAKKAQK